MDITVEKLKKHKDKRGAIVEFLTLKDIKKNKTFGHLFFATFDNKKAIRGNHYHKKQHEYYTVVSGAIKVILLDIKTKKKKTITLSSNGRHAQKLRIGPYIAHACYSITPTAVLLSYFKFPYNAMKNPDSVPYEVLK